MLTEGKECTPCLLFLRTHEHHEEGDRKGGRCDERSGMREKGVMTRPIKRARNKISDDDDDEDRMLIQVSRDIKHKDNMRLENKVMTCPVGKKITRDNPGGKKSVFQICYQLSRIVNLPGIDIDCGSRT